MLQKYITFLIFCCLFVCCVSCRPFSWVKTPCYHSCQLPRMNWLLMPPPQLGTAGGVMFSCPSVCPCVSVRKVVTTIRRGPKKKTPNYCSYLRQILTDFQNSFTGTLSSKFGIAQTSIQLTIKYGGWCNSNCIRKKVKDVNDLRKRLVEVWAELEQNVIDDAIDQWRRRLSAGVRARGGHFEHLLWIF